MLDATPVWLLATLVGIGIAGAGQLGFQLGKRSNATSWLETPDELVVGAAFTLVALLLGFTFSMAFGRFEARSTFIVSEANAVDSVAFRSNLLDATTAAEIHRALQNYAGFRLAVVDGSKRDERDRAATAARAVADEMRRFTIIAAHRDQNSPGIGLLVRALDDLTSQGAQEDSNLFTYVPMSVMFMLVTISAIATGLMGFRLGRLDKRVWISSTAIAIAIAISIGVVLDLGAPQPGGFVGVSSAPLKAAQAAIP